jgi:hypothetical protein
MMSERLAHVISSGLAGTNDLEMHLAVKGKLLSTVQTLQGFGYSTDLLNEILAQFLRRYASLMSAKFERDFRQIITEDENQAMTMDNEGDLDRILEATYLPPEGPWSLIEIKQYVSANFKQAPNQVRLTISVSATKGCPYRLNFLSHTCSRYAVTISAKSSRSSGNLVRALLQQCKRGMSYCEKRWIGF